MAKHNSFWVTSGPRLCIHVKRGKESGEKGKERRARKGTEIAGGREREGKGERMRRMSVYKLCRCQLQ